MPWTGYSWNEETTMSKFDADDLETTGYFLPECTQRRLKKLQEYVTFLAHLTRPRLANEESAEIQPSELALCLDQLEKRVAPVMEALSQPFARGKDAAASAPDVETEAHEGEDDAQLDTDADATGAFKSRSGERYLSGITLDQVDEINLLLGSLRAIGNVVCCADHAEYSKATLSVMGDAIYRDVDKIHDIVEEIYESQRFRPKHVLNSVREALASYLALPEHSPTRGALPKQGSECTFECPLAQSVGAPRPLSSGMTTCVI
jgi:hypothetical protein